MPSESFSESLQGSFPGVGLSKNDLVLEAEHVVKRYGPRRGMHWKLGKQGLRPHLYRTALPSVSVQAEPRPDLRPALNDVSVRVHEGECLAVIGASGSGKTTLTRILLGLQQSDSGTVRYRGKELSKGSESLSALRRESAIVFQDPSSSLDPRWTVGRSVGEALGLRTRGHTNAEIERLSRAAIRRVGLDDEVIFDRYPMDLSGGQIQRVAIARALVCEPSVLLADEAMSAIDMSARVQILHTLKSIRNTDPQHPMTMVLVSHDLAVVQHIADSILVLLDGSAVEYGYAEEVLNNPQHDYTKQLIAAATL